MEVCGQGQKCVLEDSQGIGNITQAHFGIFSGKVCLHMDGVGI